MAKVNFFLKEPTAEEETLVYLFFSYDNKRLKYSTGDKIHPDYWNAEKQRARETKKFDEYPEFNAWLDKCEKAVKDAYRNLKNDNQIPNNKLLKEKLDIVLREFEPAGKTTLFSFIERFIEESKGVKHNNTIKAYTNTFNHLKLYCSFAGIRSLDFEDITLDFYSAFVNYLTTDLDLAQNTIGNKIKAIKVFMSESLDRGLHKNTEFRHKKFKKPTEDTDKIYLNKNELEAMYLLDLSKNKRLEKVRDLFIIGSYTGLRFSDFIQLQKGNIIEGNKIKIRTQKTKDTVVIPLHPFVKEILDRYQGEIPPPLSNQKMNEYLKEVGKQAGIKSHVITTITKGGKIVKDKKFKYQLISSHTARRSFASNLYLANVPAIAIMKITGHKTESSFLRYIRVSQEENANNLLNHPFFN